MECEGGATRTVNVQTSPYNRNKLVIDIECISVLLMKPRCAQKGGGLVPTISEPDVKWLASQQTCRVRYYNGEANKWATKTKRVPMEGSPNRFQRSVDRAAATLQDWRNQHHTEPPDSQEETTDE